MALAASELIHELALKLVPPEITCFPLESCSGVPDVCRWCPRASNRKSVETQDQAVGDSFLRSDHPRIICIQSRKPNYCKDVFYASRS